ncbi:MAG: lipid-A-disaccharide synthase N-terminal domain-containing protein [Planctomyces sp.]|jgi:lipid-A-disaccharide synthase-like uncharacterized protein
MTSEQAWVTFGIVGQLVFMARFIVQWISSEKAGRSVMPASFWFLSIGGSAVLMAYAIHRRDPVFILGQSTGMFIYVRNIQLIMKERAAEARSAEVLEEHQAHAEIEVTESTLPHRKPRLQSASVAEHRRRAA